jgi:Tfp pilus assembly protein PilZ
MSIATMAHGARQSLTRGLEALQAKDAPPALLTAAQPIARALGALFEIEAAPQSVARAAADSALEAVREGLRSLQLPELLESPAAELAMTAVAEALGAIVEVARDLEDRATAIPQSPSPRGPLGEPAQTANAEGGASAPILASLQSTQVEPRRPHEGKRPLRAVEAALGAHSASNFYKGLAGGDIIASGGLFVATYQLPDVGQRLLLKVSMPGGYEFEATGVVAWTRNVETASSAPEAIPGFGAQLDAVSDEGRGLIQRYVRNREPMFHDDL